jgi:hypothetical protein
MITPVIHHVDKRRVCDGCYTRVFTFAEEINTAGELTGRHFCPVCAEKEARGENSNAWRKPRKSYDFYDDDTSHQ